ncbi:MAG: MscL family protein [Acidimicrobiales bacterium]
MAVFKGFKNFLLQGDLIVIAVGLIVALAFSTLIKAFTDSIITPLVNAMEGSSSGSAGMGWTVNGQRVELGAFIAAIVYFLIFMAVIYGVLVVPYRAYMAKRGAPVFGPPAPTTTCPYCLSSDLPLAATKCRHCTSELSGTA